MLLCMCVCVCVCVCAETAGIVMAPKGKMMALLRECLLALSVTNSVITGHVV
jgi:hypothetical protein